MPVKHVDIHILFQHLIKKFYKVSVNDDSNVQTTNLSLRKKTL